jgi:6,7-dimethyl-8-ribityllumazine synthase
MSGYRLNPLLEISSVPDGSTFRVGLVIAEWNLEITKSLEKGALSILDKSGLKKENLYQVWVPGSYELIAASQLILENKVVDAVICLGAVIRGETPHFEYICNAVSLSLAQISIKYIKPVIFGVLTTENMEQAKERSGGKYGNKGEDSALTALKMIQLKHDLAKAKNTPVGFF